VAVLVACGRQPSGSGSFATTLCPDAAEEALARPREAGLPVCVAPGDASCPRPEASAEPDAANWVCYGDRDCAVFAELPYCDRFLCTASQTSVTCVAGDYDSGGLPNPEIVHTYTGTNGTFTDHCDADGNLIDFQCETISAPCTVAPNCSSALPIHTGRVVPSRAVDCSGTCSAGHCDGRCPLQGDQITFRGIDMQGRDVVHNGSDGRTYACELNMDTASAANFDCANVSAGRTGYVDGVGLKDVFCTSSTVFGAVGIVIDGVDTPRGSATCVFSCGIDYAANCGGP
jgi:hypothetical protein